MGFIAEFAPVRSGTSLRPRLSLVKSITLPGGRYVLGWPSEAGLIGVGMACTAGRTFSANSRRLFSALARGIPP